MQSLSFTPGRALLESSPTNRTWSLRFEDEGVAGYLYVCDRSLGHGDDSILDAMLLYNVAALRQADAGKAAGSSPTTDAAASNVAPESAPESHSSAPEDHSQAASGSLEERLAAIEWSRDGTQAVFYLDGTAQAMADFNRRLSFCRSDFPNFLDEGNERWRSSSHAWDQTAIEQFEATLYA